MAAHSVAIFFCVPYLSLAKNMTTSSKYDSLNDNALKNRPIFTQQNNNIIRLLRIIRANRNATEKRNRQRRSRSCPASLQIRINAESSWRRDVGMDNLFARTAERICERHYRLTSGGKFHGPHKCRNCLRRFIVTVGTMFEGSNISLDKWFYAICIFL